MYRSGTWRQAVGRWKSSDVTWKGIDGGLDIYGLSLLYILFKNSLSNLIVVYDEECHRSDTENLF